MPDSYRNSPHIRILPDTNVWLDAAFSLNSVASRAVSSLHAGGASLLIDELTEREALQVLASRRLALGLDYDPALRLMAYLAKVGCLRVPPASPEVDVTGINRADRHVVRAAIHYKAALVSGDAALMLQCQQAQVFAMFPWTVIADAAVQHPMGEALRIARPTSRKGIIFARTRPGGWRGMTNVGSFTVVDVENLGRLTYDTKSLEWVFSCAIGREIKLAYPPAGQQTTIVSISYDLPGGGQRGNIILRAAQYGDADRFTRSESTLKSLKMPVGQIAIGHTLSGQDHWNGHLRHITVGPGQMTGKQWNVIAQLEDAAPNPLNHNVLDAALLSGRSLG